MNVKPCFGSYFEIKGREASRAVQRELDQSPAAWSHTIELGGVLWLRVEDEFNARVKQAAGRNIKAKASLDRYPSVDDFMEVRQLPWYKRLLVNYWLKKHHRGEVAE